MNKKLWIKYILRMMALLGVLLGVTIPLVSHCVLSAYPERRVLTEVEGVVEFVSSSRYALDFGFEGDPRVFSYARKSGEWQEVDAAIRSSANQPIKILIDSDEHAPAVQEKGNARFEVYGVSSAQSILRAYDDVRQSWRNDHRFVYALVSLCLLAAGLLEFRARRVA